MVRILPLLSLGLLISQPILAQTQSFDGNYGNPDGAMGAGSNCGTTKLVSTSS